MLPSCYIHRVFVTLCTPTRVNICSVLKVVWHRAAKFYDYLPVHAHRPFHVEWPAFKSTVLCEMCDIPLVELRKLWSFPPSRTNVYLCVTCNARSFETNRLIPKKRHTNHHAGVCSRKTDSTQHSDCTSTLINVTLSCLCESLRAQHSWSDDQVRRRIPLATQYFKTIGLLSLSFHVNFCQKNIKIIRGKVCVGRIYLTKETVQVH